MPVVSLGKHGPNLVVNCFDPWQPAAKHTSGGSIATQSDESIRAHVVPFLLKLRRSGSRAADQTFHKVDEEAEASQL